jgi:hypothetical protein
MSADYLKELTRAVEVSHGCKASHVETVQIREVFRGSVIWDGEVEVFELIGHAKAKRCYAWGYPEEGGKDGQIEAVTVLGLLPVTSPLTAVRAAIASKAKPQ